MYIRYVIAILGAGLIVSGMFMLRGLNKGSLQVKDSVNTSSLEVNAIPVEVWEWRNPSQASEGLTSDDLKLLKSQGVTAIYVSLNDLVDVAEMPDSEEKIALLEEKFLNLSNYVAVAANEGIKVHALYGNKNWASSSHNYLNGIAIDMVADYNQTASNSSRLAGIHFDHEPFSLPLFEEDPDTVLEEYLQTYELITQQMNGLNVSGPDQEPLILGIDTPYWLDGSNNNVRQLDREGIVLYPIYHLFHILEQYDASEVVLMSYRNTVEDSGGTLQLVKDELEYAQKNKLNTKIKVGQELNDEEPASITYYGKSKQYLFNNLVLIDENLSNYPNYGGIVLHELSSYQMMIEK